jgi:hypothetical protein
VHEIEFLCVEDTFRLHNLVVTFAHSFLILVKYNNHSHLCAKPNLLLLDFVFRSKTMYSWVVSRSRHTYEIRGGDGRERGD